MLSNWLMLLGVSLVAVVGWLLLTRRLTRPAWLLLGVLLLVELVLAALSQRNWPLEYRLVPWFIDMISEERNLPATLSASLLALVGVFGLYNARGLLKGWNWPNAFWLLFGLVFLILGFDEYSEIHEFIRYWKYYYGGAGILLVAATVVTFRRYWPEQWLVLALIIGGMALMASGGMVIEEIVIYRGCFGVTIIDCLRLQIFEELFEIAGTTLVLTGAVEHALRGAEPAQRRQVARFAVLGALVWGVVIAAYQFGLPAAQARWMATPVSVQYLNGDLELVAYRLPDGPITPDSGSLPVTLYWRANRRLHDEYGISAHLEEFPDLVNVTQIDGPMTAPPATAWLPGQIVPQVVEIPIPPDIEPRDYWLLLTIWTRPWYDFNYVEITQADRELLGSTTVILHTVHIAPR